MPTPQVHAYAQAIIGQVRTAAQLKAWRTLLSNLAELWQKHRALLLVWSRAPQLDIEQKVQFLEKHVLPKKNRVKQRFLFLLLRDNLWDSLKHLEKHLHTLFDDRQGRGALEIASRDPLTHEQEEAIKKQFQQHFPGREFYTVLQPLSEPGIVARFRDYVLDLRASSRLRQISYQLRKG